MAKALSRGICTSCGTGPEKQNVHHKNCLSNLPEQTAEAKAAWHEGRQDRRSGLTPKVFAGAQDEAYKMGYECPEPVDKAHQALHLATIIDRRNHNRITA